MVMAVGVSSGDGKLCTCLAAGRVRHRIGEDPGDLRASMRAARAVGIGNVQPGLDERYMSASYACPTTPMTRILLTS